MLLDEAVTFGEDATGELLIANRDGDIFKIEAGGTPSVEPPAWNARRWAAARAPRPRRSAR